jgi:uncharacterized protein YciI
LLIFALPTLSFYNHPLILTHIYSTSYPLSSALPHVQENMGDKRGPHRDGHLALAQKYLASGDLIAAGAFTPALEGALFIFKGDRSKIEEFVKNDAYNIAGLVSAYKIRDWSVPVGASNIGL